MPAYNPNHPYTQRDVLTMLQSRLTGGKYAWIRDPEGNDAVQAFGAVHLPSQPVYVNHRPSLVKMQIRFTPRRISAVQEEELWQAVEGMKATLKKAGISARRQKGHTQETERDDQWVLTIPERLPEEGYDCLKAFVMLAGSMMGIEPED